MTSTPSPIVIALQLYSVRAAGDFKARLQLAKACGYAHVETEVTYGLSAEEFANLLQENALHLASMHVEMQDLRLRMPLLLDALQRCSCKTLIMPWIEEDERPKNTEEWLALAKELNEFALQLAKQGIQLAYHNHAFEFEKLSEKLSHEQHILSFLLDHAPALTWQADVAWVYRAGEDGQAWLNRYATRLCSVHVKDLAKQGSNPDENDWANLGEGYIDWPPILQSLQGLVSCYIVEHDQPKDAKKMAQVGYAYLQNHLQKHL